ncbi:hypothetical protein HZA41_00885 [Candidatus Peregrinibacteria bacterium]|nr:hypothetical protein [Candidatus Peregrinibacteria bacterium]
MVHLKRFLPVFFAIILLFAAVGCGSSDNQANILSQEIGQKTVTEEGVLKALGVNLGQKGTHLLQKNTNEIVLVFSNYVDLDSEKYLGKKVSVTGSLLKGKKGEKDVIAVESIQTLGAGADTALKVYEDADLGFRVEYPGILTPAKSQSRVAFQNSEDSGQMIVISRIALPSGMNLEKYLSDILDVAESARSSTTIGTLFGYQVASPDDALIDIYVESGNAVFDFSHLSEKSVSHDQYREYFLTMAKSFSLISQAKAPDAPTSEVTDDMKAPESTTNVSEEQKMKGADTQTPEVLIDDTAKEVPAVVSAPVAEPSPVNTTSEAEPPTDSTEKDSQKSVMISIQTNISTIAPDPSENGGWKTTKFEFVEPNYVYVEYNDATERRKLLLTFQNDGGSITTAVVGYFQTDEDENWETVSGSNAAYGKERIVYSGADSEESFTQLPGYRYFESSTYHFKIQYPSAWYFSGSAGVYSFSDKPVEADNTLVTLEVRKQGLSGISGASSEINGFTILVTEEEGVSVVYAGKDDSRSYRLSGAAFYKSILETMAGTITD